MSKRTPFNEITEDMVLEEYRKQRQHLSHDFQHLEVQRIDDWKEVETEYGERGYKFVIICRGLSGYMTRYEHYAPQGWLHVLTENVEEDEEDYGDFLGHHLDDGEADF